MTDITIAEVQKRYRAAEEAIEAILRDIATLAPVHDLEVTVNVSFADHWSNERQKSEPLLIGVNCRITGSI